MIIRIISYLRSRYFIFNLDDIRIHNFFQQKNIRFYLLNKGENNRTNNIYFPFDLSTPLQNYTSFVRPAWHAYI